MVSYEEIEKYLPIVIPLLWIGLICILVSPLIPLVTILALISCCPYLIIIPLAGVLLLVSGKTRFAKIIFSLLLILFAWQVTLTALIALSGP